MIKQIWKNIPGFENYYQVSNLGKVRSLNRIVKSSHLSSRIVKGRILKNNIQKSGYYAVTLSFKCKVYTKYIHRLVAECFITDYSEILDVNHKDFNRINNNIENLEMVTKRNNNIHSSKKINEFTGTYKSIYNRWIASIGINNKKFHLGTYETQELAHDAYKKALKKHIDNGGV